MPNKYTSEYFFERLKQIRRVMQTLKSYKALRDLMAIKEVMPSIGHVNTRQGLEK